MYLSDLKAEVESRGRTFTPELYDKAVAKFGKKLVVDAWRPGAAPAVPDFNDPIVLAQEKRMQDEGAEGQLDIPLPDRMVNSLARGLTFGVVDPMEPPRMESTGIGALDRTASDALIGASDLAGMIGASSLLPGAGLAGKAGRLASMGQGAATLGQYGTIRGAVETGFQDPGEVVKRGLKDALLGGLLPLAPHGTSIAGKAASQFGIGAGLAGAGQVASGEFDPSGIASSGLALALAGGLTGIPEVRAARSAKAERASAEAERAQTLADLLARRDAERFAAEDAMGSPNGVIEQHKRLWEQQDGARVAEAAQAEIDRQKALEDARWAMAEKTSRDQLSPTGQKRDLTPEEAAAVAPSIVLPGSVRPGSIVDKGAPRQVRPIEVVPGGVGEPISPPVLRRPGQTRDPEYPLNTAEEYGRGVVDEELRTYKGDRFPLNPPENAPMEKPGFLRPAEEVVRPDQVEYTEPTTYENVRPEQDITLGTAFGGLQDVGKKLRRPGQRKPKPAADPTGEVAEREFARPDLFRVPDEDLVVPKPIRGDYRGTGALDAGRSVSGRLERMDESSAEISARFNEALAVGSGNEGKTVGLMDAAGLNEKLTPDQRRDLGRAMRGTLDPGSLTGPAASAFRGFRAYLKTVIARARAAGLDIGELPNYFHQSIPSARELRSGPKRERIIENMVHSRPAEFPTPESAATAIDAYVDVITKKGRGSDRWLAERMAKKQGITVEEARGQIALYRRAPKVREFGGFKERSEDLPFYDPDPVESFARYIEGAEMRIAEAHAFGPKMEKIESLIGKIEDPEVREVTKQLVEFIRKPDALDDPASRGVLAEFRKITGLKLGPMTTAKNLQQILAGLLATDTATFVRGLRASRTTFGEQVGLNSGATVGQAKRSLRGLSGGYQKYHTATGLIPSERWGRKAAANMGRLWAEKMTKQMIESKPGSRQRRFAERQLRTMDVDPAKIAESGGISEAQLDRAAFQMSENTFFGYRAKDVPKAFNENAIQRTIFQFKAFGAQQSRMVARQTIDELRSGHPGRFARNVAILALVYPMSGEVTNDIIAAVQGKKRPDGFQRWLEDAMSVGVTANFLFDVAQGAKYGNAAEAAAGPAFGSAADTGELLYSVVSKGELSESNRRKLVRMVPFIGPLIAYHVVPKSNEEADESEGPKGRPGRVRPGSSRPGTRRPGRTRPARN